MLPTLLPSTARFIPRATGKCPEMRIKKAPYAQSKYQEHRIRPTHAPLFSESAVTVTV